MTMDDFNVGDKVRWIHTRRIYKGYELEVREGVVESLHNTFAIVKPPKKRSRRVSIYLKDLERAGDGVTVTP